MSQALSLERWLRTDPKWRCLVSGLFGALTTVCTRVAVTCGPGLTRQPNFPRIDFYFQLSQDAEADVGPLGNCP